MEVKFELKGYKAGELKTSIESNDVVDVMMLIAVLRELYDDMTVRYIGKTTDETRHYGKNSKREWELLDVKTNQVGGQA